MKVTVDANILFSALLKKSLTRRIWFVPEVRLFAPRFLLREFQKYASHLEKKYQGTVEEFQSLCEKLLGQVVFVQDEELKPYMPAAASLSNDPKDWLYLACALKEDTIIWSDDKEFKKQARIETKTTQEMKEEVGLL